MPDSAVAKNERLPWIPLVLMLLGTMLYFSPLMDATLLPRLGIFVGLISWLLFQKNFIWRFDPWSISGWLALYVVYAIFNQLLFGQSTEGWLEVVKIFTGWGIFMSLNYLLFHHPSFDKQLLPFTLVVITIQVLAVVYQIAIGENNAQEITGLAGHANLLGAQFFLLIGFCLVQLLYKSEAPWNVLLGLVLCFFLFGTIVGLEIRSATLALIVLFAFVLFTFFGGKKITTAAGGVIISGLVVLTFLVAASNIDESLITTYQLHEVDWMQTWIERSRVWSQSWQLYVEQPIMGMGLGNWQFEFPNAGLENIYSATMDRTTFQRPHNDLLWTISEMGIIGLIFQLGLFAFPFIKLYQAKGFEVSGKMKILLGTWLGFLLISCFSFPKERPELIFWSLFLLAYIDYWIPTPQPQQGRILPKWILWIPVLLSMVLIIGRGVGEYYNQKMLRSYLEDNLSATVSLMDKSTNFFYQIDPTSMPLAWYPATLQFKAGKTEEACINFARAFELSAHNFHILNDWGSCQELQGNRPEAIELYQEALRINPIFEDAKRNLTIVLIKSERWTEAKKWALQLSNDEMRRQYLQLIQERWREE